MGPLSLQIEIEAWPLSSSFRIAGYTFEVIDVLLVTLGRGGHFGKGEAAGVYYRDDTPSSMATQIEALRPEIEAGISRESLQQSLPPGGARNALDCALWDLEAKVCNHSAWQRAGLEKPRPLLTTFTCGAEKPESMAAVARNYTNARAIKLKLTGESVDAERVLAVREARPDVWLCVDANQGFSRDSLEQLMVALVQARVAIIEQPFPLDHDYLLDGFQSPIPIVADESAQCLADIPRLIGRFNGVNIKLDKCGGLTEGLAMVRTARAAGLSVMVGNMLGTSLAMAPAFLVGQLCDVVDLDGSLFLRDDRAKSVHYSDGFISCPDAVWGHQKS
jgi:L-Ala-D/L-Glu epimerase / N-acetyl-D-glutamate racemase